MSWGDSMGPSPPTLLHVRTCSFVAGETLPCMPRTVSSHPHCLFRLDEGRHRTRRHPVERRVDQGPFRSGPRTLRRPRCRCDGMPPKARSLSWPRAVVLRLFPAPIISQPVRVRLGSRSVVVRVLIQPHPAARSPVSGERLAPSSGASGEETLAPRWAAGPAQCDVLHIPAARSLCPDPVFVHVPSASPARDSLPNFAPPPAEASRAQAGQHQMWFHLQMVLAGCTRPPRPPLPPPHTSRPLAAPLRHQWDTSVAWRCTFCGCWVRGAPPSCLSPRRGAPEPYPSTDTCSPLTGRGIIHAVRVAPALASGRFPTGPTPLGIQTALYGR